MNPKKQPKTYWLLMTILCALTLGAGFVFVEGHAILDAQPLRAFTPLEFWLGFSICLSLIVTVIILSHRWLKLKVNWIWVILFALWFLVNLFAIVLFEPIYYENQIVYNLDLPEKIRSIFLGLVAFSLLYLLFAIFPKVTGGSQIYRFVFALPVVLAIVSIFYTYAFEGATYLRIFSNFETLSPYDVPKGWYNTRNGLAFVVLAGIMAEGYLEVKKPGWWRWLIIFYLYAHQFILLSKTSLFISTIFIVLLIPYHFVRTIKAHPMRNAFLLLAMVGVGVFIALLPHISEANPFFRNLYRYEKAVIELLKTFSGRSVSAREIGWQDVIDSVFSSQVRTLFGFGGNHAYSSVLAFNYGSPDHPGAIDGAFFLNLARGGSIGAGLSVLVWIILFGYIIKAFGQNNKHAYVLLLIFGSFLAHAMIESDDFGWPNGAGIGTYLMVALPILSEDWEINHQDAIEKGMDGLLSPDRVVAGKNTHSASRKATFLLFPIFMVLFAIWHIFPIYHPDWFFSDVRFMILALLVAFLLPQWFSVIGNSASFGRRIWIFWTLVGMGGFGTAAAFAFLRFTGVEFYFLLFGGVAFAEILILWSRHLPRFPQYLSRTLLYLSPLIGMMVLSQLVLTNIVTAAPIIYWFLVVCAALALWVLLFFGLGGETFPKWAAVEGKYCGFLYTRKCKANLLYEKRVKGKKGMAS